MAGQNGIIDVQTFPGLSRAEDQCEGDAAQAGRSPYWKMWASYFSAREWLRRTNVKIYVEDHAVYLLVYGILASVAIVTVAVVTAIFLL
jgi:hypothetical protein